MRRFLDQFRLFHIRRARLRARRRGRFKQNRKLRRLGLSRPSVVVLHNGKKHKTRTLHRISLPQVLCLDENTSETLRVLADIRNQVLSRSTEAARATAAGRIPEQPRRFFDFKDLTRLGPSAALVLAAVYQRAKYITGKKLWTVDEHRWRPEVISVLRALGFHELLEMKPLRKGGAVSGPIHIQRFMSGERVDGEAAGKLQDALAALLPDQLRHNFFTTEPYGGMLEAILNSHMWAYPPDHEWEHPLLANWWLTGAVDTETNEVVVVVYDQGVSIPRSLPHWKHWGRLEAQVKRAAARLRLTPDLNDSANDGVAIRMAMRIARTATSLPQHGKGLHTMVEVAERARYGRLRILSRNGEYIWETGKRPRSFTHPHALHGTLIEWQLRL